MNTDNDRMLQYQFYANYPKPYIHVFKKIWGCKFLNLRNMEEACLGWEWGKFRPFLKGNNFNQNKWFSLNEKIYTVKL